jgi:Cu2+-exporting ATPase
MSLAAPAQASSAEPAPPLQVGSYVQHDEAGHNRLHLMVEGLHCGGCVRKIETALQPLEGVREARVNLTTRRLAIAWDGPVRRGDDFARTVEGLGFKVVPYEPARLTADDARQEKELLRCMAVAGFAAANVMLLSVSVWAGHVEGMGPATRTLMHWFSALIALPAIAYAGRPFFRSALAALKARTTNMDVPISLAVLLASGMSLVETMNQGEHAYFDSAVMLLFFLLIGRYLDRRARGKARSAAERLLALGASAVTVIAEGGKRLLLKPEEVQPGMTVLAAAGERIAVDGTVLEGESEVDTSLITGESLPTGAAKGTRVFAGTLNMAAPLTLEVTATGERTLLAEIVRLMEVAEQRRARFVSLADRMARVYAPVVHLLALGTFLGWWLLGGLAWQPSLMIAIAVLIITCPCALGLAVPAVQVIASGRLLRSGLLLKSGTALERLAVVDTVVFDKTGTLTLGRPDLIDLVVAPEDLELAASLAAASRHPLARALCRAAPDVPAAGGVKEVPGCGLLLETPEGEVRLGSRRWTGVEGADLENADLENAGEEVGPELWLIRPWRAPQRFVFSDRPRADARAVIAELRRRGLRVELLSGDRSPTVAAVAQELGIETWRAELAPADKVTRLEQLAAEGRRVLMAGDGLNDAPALAAASVSVSPSSAVDISQTAADAVFQGEALWPVVDLLEVARRADRLVKQNFGLALLYNACAIPLAVAGFVTPLIAAAAMSGSSILVISNALRLSRR